MRDAGRGTVVFRVDASIQIGTGHAMRCLTLANALASAGARCHFICREHPGHVAELVRTHGHAVHLLPPRPEALVRRPSADGDPKLAHSDWLGSSQKEDARDCVPVLEALRPQWLVIDHYALDCRWQRAVRTGCRNIMVLDDLADREHDCDLLLDQTLGRDPLDYASRVPAHCSVLAGSRFALLRPEFAALRPASLRRRGGSELRELLITMGGVDPRNCTGLVLESLRGCELEPGTRISVILGRNAPWSDKVRQQAAGMPCPTEVRANVTDMADRMARCDAVIGAGGSTTWEQCCLGVPGLLLALADNQRKVLQELERAGAALVMHAQELQARGCDAMQQYLRKLRATMPAMVSAAAAVADGRGTERVVEALFERVQ